MNRARALQWSRTSFALAALFGSFPVVGRVLIGDWTFEGAFGLACLWLGVGGYLRLRARRLRAVADSAALLEEAIHSANSGDTEAALRILDRTLVESPRFWQAYQCRGELWTALGETEAALADFDAALRLAPDEPHLRELRDRTAGLSASADEA